MKYFFECPCGAYGDDLYDEPEGTLHYCLFCEKALVVEPHKTGPMRFATEAEIAANEANHQMMMNLFAARMAALTKKDN
jgi:hypothetical protein